MRTIITAIVMMAAVLVIASPAQAAFPGGGGKKPSEAQTIAWGQHYFSELDNHKESANFDGDMEVAFWRLPAVSNHDELVVNWHSVPQTNNPGNFPVCMAVVQGVNESTWGELFEHQRCYPPYGFQLSGSGTAASKITIQESDLGSGTYLEFWTSANSTLTSHEQQGFPYDFTVEAPRHYLNMTIAPFDEIPANGVVNASVTDATGIGAPDGLVFGLTVRWNEGGIATYSATSSGGHVAFQLALPEAAYKKSANFVTGRGADASYQAVESPSIRAEVTTPALPPAPPPPPKTKPLISRACKKSKSLAHVFARQHHRLVANSRRARGVRRSILRRRSRKVAAEWRHARAKVAAACA